MTEFKGDATQEDVDKQVLKDLRARLASSSSTVPVTLTQSQAARLFEMAGGSMEVEEEEKLDPKKAARVSAPGQYPEPMPMVSQQSPEQKAGVPSEPKPGEQQASHTKSPEETQNTSGQQSGQSRSGSKAKMSRAQLEAMTKDELIEEADERGVEYSSSWTKGDIVEAILKQR